jgi:hypothetical protein
MSQMLDEQQQYSMMNHAQLMNPSFMEMRLSNKQLLKNVEHFLSAKRKNLIKNEDGTFSETVVSIGKPLANSEGINHILNILSMRTDAHVVQGNYREDHYWDFIERARCEIAEQIIINCYDWDIEDSKIEQIIDTIMSFIEPFISRLINNEERKSYMQQFMSREVISQGQKRNAISQFVTGGHE